MALFASNILIGFIWTCIVVSIVINIFCFVIRLLQKRECRITSFFLHNLAAANTLVSIFLILIAAMDANFALNTPRETLHRYQSLCNLTGFIGTLAFNMTLTIMITMSTDLLLRKLFPRKFRRTKNYLPFYRILFLAEWVAVCAVSAIPYLPVQYFQPNVQHFWDTLCLPLRPPQESLWIYTLVLFCYSAFIVVTISLEIFLIICQLQRQKNMLIMAIPMEARVIRREIIFAKRFCFIILSTTVCWIPVLVVGFNAYAGSSISKGLIQWIFGLVLPFESILNPLLYLATLGAEQGRVGLFLHSCKQKVSGSGNTLKIKLRQLTGSVSMTRDMYIYRSSEGEAENGQIESLQRSSKSPPPTDVKWLETLHMAGHEKSKPMFGKIEWTSRSNALRRGMIKLFSKSHYKRWKNEISTLEKIAFAGGHPNVLTKYWHSDNHKTIVIGGPPSTQSSILAVERYLCTPVFEFGNLRNLLEEYQGKLTDTDIHKITNQITDGLCFLHMRNILHNRIQATNIMIGGSLKTLKVVISDFGKAKDVTTIRRRKRGGTIQKSEETIKTYEDNYLNVPGSISLKVFHENEWAENVELFVADIRAFAIMLCEMLLWSSTETCRKYLSATGRNNFAFLQDDNTAKEMSGDGKSNDCLASKESSHVKVNAEMTSPSKSTNIKSINESQEFSKLNGHVRESSMEDGPAKREPYVGGGHRHHFVQSMPPPVFGDLTTKHLDMLLEEANNQVLEMEMESKKLKSINTDKSEEVLNHRILYDRKYRESLVNLLTEFQEESDQQLENSCELTCPTKSLEEELCKSSRTLKKEKNNKAVEKDSNEMRSSSDSSGTEVAENDLFGLDSTNDLLQLLPDGSSKRKSICSTDSGISSQQESLSNFTTNKNGKKDQNPVIGMNNKVPGWSRHLQSNSLSPTPFHFRNIPRCRTTIYAKSSTDNDIPSFSVLSQMIETWIQSHADQDCEYRSSILDGVQKSRANIPETIPESDSDKRYSDLRKACSTGAIDDDSNWNDENDQKNQSTPGTPEPKHKSSLSQFYVRKTGTKNTGTPGFTKATNKNVASPVHYHGRQYSNHLYKKWRSADNVNNHRNGINLTCPKCLLPDRLLSPELDVTDPLQTPVQGRCNCAPLNNCLNSAASPQLRKHWQNENIYTPMLPANNQKPQQRMTSESFMPEITELCTTNLDTPDVQYFDCDVVLPSGVNKHHQFYLSELQRQFSWLPQVTAELLRDEERRCKAFSNWLQVLRRDKGYLHQQMVKIVERSWREEPPLAAQEIKDLLLKCLPETPL
ncbi:uncharacterized protein LOC117122453 [Anneissia japonica]|uniref:uncharacterized protein LOC117122453 n=1 Tax=Anneissia japonica TaxID=1529436 RepID=UPI0014258B36|nr:uncharacterized protein LOC117122453 [Anneissia japonica]XP_033123926.1 uncharacterized protein LOC117122453 [Anneissia japonica]XP_033123927.1 uncharacterized protein LOC117122453 [Anneissia japonica]